MFERLCPSCKKPVYHTSKSNRDQADNKGRLCKTCDYERRKEAYKGENNPFYGKKHSAETIERFKKRDHPHVKEEWFKELRRQQMLVNNPNKGTDVYSTWVTKYGKEEADRRDAIRKAKWSAASSGENNAMFGKPSPQGAGNGWSGWYGEWYFRSLKELAYVVKVLEPNNLSWVSAERKAWRIPYKDWDGASRSYAADFLVDGTMLVEIKPINLKDTPLVHIKRVAAEGFCQQMGWEYLLVDPPRLTNEEVRELRQAGCIRFIDRYEKLYQEKYAQ